MTKSGIYKIQSIIKPHRCYIGSSYNIDKRWEEHLKDLRKEKHHSIKLQRHYNKYGEKDLIFILIEPCFPNWLITREQYYLDLIHPYFNTCKLAYSCRGVKRSKEIKEKISNGGKGLKRPESFIIKNRERMIGNKYWLGRKHSPETILKMRKPRTEETKQKMRKPKSEEWKQKMSIAMSGFRHSEETKLKMSRRRIGTHLSSEIRNKMSISQKRRFNLQKTA
jgi:group I intron endonuclease